MSSMTKKDYELIALAVSSAAAKAAWCFDSASDVQAIANHFADHLSINPRFDRAKFLTACGIK